MIYIITEKDGPSDLRGGTYMPAPNLKAAKQLAESAKLFQRTCMTVEDEYGRLLSWFDGKTWFDQGGA